MGEAERAFGAGLHAARDVDQQEHAPLPGAAAFGGQMRDLSVAADHLAEGAAGVGERALSGGGAA
jgi:hypothetical protein